MKILVTGGAGYIGSVTVERLVADGESVVVLDNLSQGHRAAVSHGAEFINAHLAHRRSIDAALAQHKPDAVMHFAANSSVGDSMQRPFEYLGANVSCGLNLLESMVAHGVRRFVLSSTASLFGSPDKMPIAEDATISPGSPYGESKYLLERMLPWLEQVHGLRFAVLRYFNAAGASDEHGENHDPETHLIPLLLQRAAAKADQAHVTIFGDDYPTRDGTCIRDYIHVVDLADAHVLALRALGGGSRVYNLGSGTGASVKEVLECARRVTGLPIPARIGARRLGDPPALIASSEKIRRELGWTPVRSDLREIIGSAWRWHLKHPNGYGE